MVGNVFGSLRIGGVSFIWLTIFFYTWESVDGVGMDHFFYYLSSPRAGKESDSAWLHRRRKCTRIQKHERRQKEEEEKRKKRKISSSKRKQ